MSKLIELFVQYSWERGIKPFLDRGNWWDVGFAAVLFGYAYLQWVIFWEGRGPLSLLPGTFNDSERLLWGTLLAVATLGWFCARKAGMLIRMPTRPTNAWSTVVLLIVFAVVTTSWSYATYRVYRIPVFRSSTTGLFIARLSGDDRDHAQHDIVEHVEQGLDRWPSHKISVSTLPRWPSSHRRARELGKRGRASLVVWGQRLKQKNLVRLNVTPVHVSALIETGETAGAEVHLDRSYVNSLPVDGASDDYKAALPLFLAGYEMYFSGEYAKTIAYLKLAKTHLERRDERGLSSDQSLLGSINFYLGNTYVACASTTTFLEKCDIATSNEALTKARRLYRSAAEIVASPTKSLRDSYYAEALNNLVFLVGHQDCVVMQTSDQDSDRDQHCHPERARDYLERAYDLCRDPEIPFQPSGITCAHVAYNLGSFLQKERSFAKALPYFHEAISIFQRTEQKHELPGDLVDYWFFAQAHQALAYNYARMGETVEDDGHRLAQFEKSENFTKQAIAIMEDYGYKVPSRFGVARARIHIGRSQWRDAIKELERAQSSMENYAELHLLWAIAEECIGNRDGSRDHLERFLQLNATYPVEARDGMQYFKRATLRCRRLAG